MHIADRLAQAVLSTGTPLCVGLDPRLEQLPRAMQPSEPTLAAAADAVARFCMRVIDLIAGRVGVVKPQSAFFELFGPPGLAALQRVQAHARAAGLVTILDSKRGDIASTAEAYAQAALGVAPVGDQRWPVWDADLLTVNPYLGRDAIEPFIRTARAHQRGLFVLVRTSNRGAGLFQDLLCDGKPLYRHVAEAVAAWAAESLGACGLGDVGAVVGATHPAELAELRAVLPQVWLLVPGFGAQGGTADDVRAAFRADGLGALVNSSRGITFPTHPDDPDWEGAITHATTQAIDALASVTPALRNHAGTS
jgi:orotidine-5'-phosphate decarboxylase